MRVSLVTLGDPNTKTGGYLYHRRMGELAPSCDAEISFASFPRRRFPFPALARYEVLRAAAEGDVIVLDSIAAAFWGKPRRGLPPVAAMAHQPPGGIDHGALRTASQALLDLRAYERVDLLMVASHALAGELRKRKKVQADKVVVVPPGRDVAQPAGPENDLREGRRAAILCVGNWVQRKGIVELVQATASLPPDAATLHLVGDDTLDGAYAARVRDLMRDPAVAERVRFHGAQPTEIVAAMYRDADLFALPSVREPYGTVYAEAMAFGLPVIGWNAGNLPHLARHGVEGIIVPTGDILALGRALAGLARDDELRERLGANARLRAETFPTWEQTADLFFHSLRALIEGR